MFSVRELVFVLSAIPYRPIYLLYTSDSFRFRIVHTVIFDKINDYKPEKWICLPQLPADNDAMPGFLLRSSHVNPTPYDTKLYTRFLNMYYTVCVSL